MNGGVGTSAIDGTQEIISRSFQLKQNYPNPFNSQTTIEYNLLSSSNIYLAIYDLTGKKVADLINERQEIGLHQITWEAGELASGIYVCYLRSGKKEQIRKILLVK